MDTTQDPWEMTRDQLEALLAEMRALDPNAMPREELAYYNSTMSAYDAMLEPYQ